MKILDMPYFSYILLLAVIWDIVWKLIALWKSARNNQIAWFVVIGIINSIGILPIIYLITQKYKKK
ncbi:MAG: DUF5652 family protein [Bacteroidales bacterium]|mgnify:CR=1 FL=1|jgi:hypothetical protein|nr:DUF5652 family protein [Bacteroidales bacterium]